MSLGRGGIRPVRQSVLDPSPPSLLDRGITITIGAPSPHQGQGYAVTGAEAIGRSAEFAADSRYASFFEWLERAIRDAKGAFRPDEVPPPMASYFEKQDT